MKRLFCLILFCFVMMFSIFSSAGAADNPITVAFSYVKDAAYIGQPFTVNYEISGGSGEYTDIFFCANSVTEMCVIDFYQQEMSSAKGSCTIIPECGESIDFTIVCTDVVTNKKWACDSEKIELKPNPDILVSLEHFPVTAEIDKPVSIHYSVDTNDEIAEGKISLWTFVEDDIYPDCLKEEVITSQSGSIVYTPRLGRAFYIAFQGKDTAGRQFYVRTNRIKIEGSASTTPVTVDFSFQDRKVQIGHPFTVNYEISGGSGEYTDIFFCANSVTEMCVIDFYQQEMSNAKGSCTVIPECGASIDFTMVCTDAVTNKKWENYSEKLACVPNSKIPVTLIDIPKECCIDKELRFTYCIDSINPLAEATISYWVFIEDEIYPDLLYEHKVSALNGSSAYIPKVGRSLYIAIQGKDVAGEPFYAKTERIVIRDTVMPTSTPAPTYTPAPTPTHTPTPATNIGDIVGGEGNFSNLSSVDVPTLILPDGVLVDASAILQYDQPKVNKKNTVVYDVNLVNSDGKKIKLPEGAILCFPHPDGLDETSMRQYRIVIHHYRDDKGVETFSTEDNTIELKKQGLCIQVSSFSPFVIEWEEQPKVDLPKTGDDSQIALWFVVLMLAGVALMTLNRKIA